MRLRSILIFFCFISSIIVNSQSNDCETLLNKELYFKNEEFSKSDLITLKECGYDINQYTDTLLFLAIGELYNQGETVNYKNLFLQLEKLSVASKKQMKNQMIMSVFKFTLVLLVLITIIYWIRVFVKQKKFTNKVE